MSSWWRRLLRWLRRPTPPNIPYLKSLGYEVYTSWFGTMIVKPPFVGTSISDDPLELEWIEGVLKECWGKGQTPLEIWVAGDADPEPIMSGFTKDQK